MVNRMITSTLRALAVCIAIVLSTATAMAALAKIDERGILMIDVEENRE